MFNQPGGDQNQQLPVTNYILFFILSLVLIVAYMFLVPQPPAPVAEQPGEEIALEVESAPQRTAVEARVGELFGTAGALATVSQNLAGEDVAHGQIDEASGIFYDLTLDGYNETIEEGSKPVAIFNWLEKSPLPYYFEPFVSSDSNGATKGETPVFTRASAEDGIALTGTTDDGLVIDVAYESVGEHLYRVTMKASNPTDETLGAVLGGSLMRSGLSNTAGEFTEMPGVQTIWTARQGLAFFEDGRVARQAYDQIADKPRALQFAGSDWIAFADKYFMSALIPAENNLSVSSYSYIDGQPGYFSARVTNAVGGQLQQLEPGNSTSFAFDLFVGPKELSLLRQYENELNAEQFAFTIDFGWFWYFTMPFTQALAWLGDLVGNVGVAILIITVIIKAFLFPLANNSYRSMARMKKLQPKMEELREKHGEDRQALSQATMALYRSEGANPISGCLPMLVQIPIFFALYKVIFNTIEIRHAPFFGWIQDMAAKDPTSWINGFGLLPYDIPGLFMEGSLLALLSVGIWPILMGLTMVLQQRLSPAPADPTQAMIFKVLPIVFTFFMAAFPAGLVIYWTWNNFLSVIQQQVIMRSTMTESEEKKEAEAERQKAKAEKKLAKSEEKTD